MPSRQPSPYSPAPEVPANRLGECVRIQTGHDQAMSTSVTTHLPAWAAAPGRTAARAAMAKRSALRQITSMLPWLSRAREVVVPDRSEYHLDVVAIARTLHAGGVTPSCLASIDQLRSGVVTIGQRPGVTCALAGLDAVDEFVAVQVDGDFAAVGVRPYIDDILFSSWPIAGDLVLATKVIFEGERLSRPGTAFERCLTWQRLDAVTAARSDDPEVLKVAARLYHDSFAGDGPFADPLAAMQAAASILSISP